MERSNPSNCVATYVSMTTGVTHDEAFHDPYIYAYRDPSTGRDICVQWNGLRWSLGPSYAGAPVLSRLRRVADLSRPPPDAAA